MRRTSDGLLTSHVGGRTWWGRRWLEILDEAVDVRGPRGVRGRTLARDGNVGELEVVPGRITARVSVGPTRAFRTAITLPTLDDDQWSRLLDVLASELRWTAAFASHRLPEEIVEAEEAAGVQLFPTVESMTWEDEGDPEVPGRHAIALHHAVAGAMETNPLLLAAMRGRRPDEVLAALRARRAGRDDEEGRAAAARDAPVPTTDDHYRAGDLEAITVHPHEPEDTLALLERLGLPPRIEDGRSVANLIDQAADLAWKIAAGEGSDQADDELLLAELRALRMAGPVRMGEALGWDPERAAEALDRLFDEGRVLRTGTGDRIRYRAT